MFGISLTNEINKRTTKLELIRISWEKNPVNRVKTNKVLTFQAYESFNIDLSMSPSNFLTDFQVQSATDIQINKVGLLNGILVKALQSVC